MLVTYQCYTTICSLSNIVYSITYITLISFLVKKNINMRSKSFLYSTGIIDESLQEIVSNIKEQNDEKKLLEVNCLSFYQKRRSWIPCIGISFQRKELFTVYDCRFVFFRMQNVNYVNS